MTEKVGVATSIHVWNGSDVYMHGMSSATNQKVTELKRGRNSETSSSHWVSHRSVE